MVKKRKPGPKATNSKTLGKKARSEDDVALWQAFTQNIHQLELKGRIPDTESDFLDEMLRRESVAAKRTFSPAALGKKRVAETPTTSKPFVPKLSGPKLSGPKSFPQPDKIDARQVRRITKGRDGIEARIDLHGMHQQEAHSSLRAFLFRSVSKGHRMVLVITGKGRVRPDSDDHFGAFINEGALGRGVLRRNVPLWLAEPDMRSIVVGYTFAHIRHGGDGALYVQLRRQR